MLCNYISTFTKRIIKTGSKYLFNLHSPMKKLFLIILLFCYYSSHAQKIYVWCPENFDVKPRIGLTMSDTVNISFFDGRSIPKKNKIECSTNELFQTIFSQLKVTYPSIIFNLLPESDYYKKNGNQNNITIKIGVAAYHAGFGTDISGGIGIVGGQFSTMIIPKGQWNAITAYYVQLYKDGKNLTKEISNLASKPNIWGYKSARTALNETYNKSNQEMLFFIDQEFMK